MEMSNNSTIFTSLDNTIKKTKKNKPDCGIYHDKSSESNQRKKKEKRKMEQENAFEAAI